MAGKAASEAASTLTAPTRCADRRHRGEAGGTPRACPPTSQHPHPPASLPGFRGRSRASSEAGPGPGTGESTPGMRWLIKVPRTDGRQCQQNGFWAAGRRILPLSDLCCVLRGREPGPLPKLLRCFHIHASCISSSWACLVFCLQRPLSWGRPSLGPRASLSQQLLGQGVCWALSAGLSLHWVS